MHGSGPTGSGLFKFGNGGMLSGKRRRRHGVELILPLAGDDARCLVVGTGGIGSRGKAESVRRSQPMIPGMELQQTLTGPGRQFLGDLQSRVYRASRAELDAADGRAPCYVHVLSQDDALRSTIFAVIAAGGGIDARGRFVVASSTDWLSGSGPVTRQRRHRVRQPHALVNGRQADWRTAIAVPPGPQAVSILILRPLACEPERTFVPPPPGLLGKDWIWRARNREATFPSLPSWQLSVSG